MDPDATPLSAPHPNAPRADTCTRVSRRYPCTAAVASQRMPHAATCGEKSRHVRHLATCARRQGACSFSGKKLQLDGSAGRHDGHSWRTRSPPTTKHPGSDRTCNGPACRASEDKRGRVGGSGWEATARAVRSALLRDQQPFLHGAPRDTPSPHDFRPPVGRGKPPTRGACAVLSSSIRTQRVPVRTSRQPRGPHVVRARSGGTYFGRTGTTSAGLHPHPPPQQRERRPHLGGRGGRAVSCRRSTPQTEDTDRMPACVARQLRKRRAPSTRMQPRVPTAAESSHGLLWSVQTLAVARAG